MSVSQIFISAKFRAVDLEEICHIAIQILEQTAICYQDPGQVEVHEPMDDQAEYGSMLISSAGDLVADLTAVLSADFALASIPSLNLVYVIPVVPL